MERVSNNRNMTFGSETLAVEVLSESRLHRLDRLSHLLDTAFRIPGTRFRFGFDGLLGLIPGVGDTIGAALSAYIILEAARLGFSKRTLLRMGGNVAIEALVGIIPILGDIFDIAWKANVKNVALLRTNRDEIIKRDERSLRQIIRLLMVVIVLTMLGLVVFSIFTLRFLYQLITA